MLLTSRLKGLVLLSRFRDIYEAFEDYFSGLMLFIGLSLIFINVILRYFFGKPQSLLDEFSVYFVVWGILAGIAVALRNNHHIKVDIVYGMLSIKTKRVVGVFSNTIGLAFAMFYMYFGYELVQNYIQSGQRSTDSQFPLWIVNLIMPISGILFSIRFIDKLHALLFDGGKRWLESMQKGGHH
ncbi:MAG: TRAP transporter small permease [Bacillota bacterium]